MKIFAPDYYKNFKCTNSKCRHNCCIGWEIDIDDDSYEYYKSAEGSFGKRLRENIAYDDCPHFILGKDERCPFLNGDNLCDLITELGEEALCTICREHPRFYNELQDRVECGLGLCCEQACRLALIEEDFSLLAEEDGKEIPIPKNEEEILKSRERIFELMASKKISFESCPQELLDLFDLGSLPMDSTSYAVELYKLERLDDKWTALLEELLCEERQNDEEDRAKYKEALGDLSSSFGRFFLYLIYRHYATAFDDRDAAARGLFALQSTLLLNDLSFIKWRKTGEISAEDLVELARLFSSEIEYSEENVDALFDLFYDFSI